MKNKELSSLRAISGSNPPKNCNIRPTKRICGRFDEIKYSSMSLIEI